ncbi:MAG: outer membrane beta-barrel protein [Flavobacterium sp.]
MKKVLLSAVALLAFGFANAQEEKSNGGFSKGDIFISGSVGFGSEKFGDFDSKSTNFSPAAGYFLTENIALGAQLRISSAENVNVIVPGLGSGTVEKFSSVGADIFGRYYFTPADKFSLFGQLAVGFGTDTYEDGGEFEGSSFGINAGLGLNYFVSSNFALQATWAGLGYNSYEVDGVGESYDTFGLNADLSNINLGLVYKF